MKDNKKKQNKKRNAVAVLTGVLDVSLHGTGYVMVQGMDTDIKVNRENLRNAMNGDTVEVTIIKGGQKGKRPEGLVTGIVKRGQEELIGTVEMNMKFAFVIPDNKHFNKDIFISEKNSRGLKSGDRVVVRVIDWNENFKNPEGMVLSVLSEEKANEIAMLDILLSQGFSLEFPREVMDETSKIQEEILDADIEERRDLRKILTFTIDPFDAKDFDDAISYKKLPSGLHRVGVHIADVAHYVKPGTELDREAYKRATSVYLPDRVLPMLPEKISNELCSLRPLEDKLTFSVVFDMDDDGYVQDHWIGKTIIHSNKRYTYEEVQEIIETGRGHRKEVILLLNDITQKIRKRKFRDGAINFTSEESKFILDEFGVPEGVVVKESKEAHQLIEELMLMANKTIAEYVSAIEVNRKPVPFPYRIHDAPDPEKLKPFTAFAGKFGYRFDLSTPQSIAKSFNKMLSSTHHNPEHAILHTLGIRTMAKAVYSTENIGHYGLAFEHYCHFTSPIRRYPDVLVHRILLQCLQKKIKPMGDLEERCGHCSERERKAMEAERDANKYKQVEFMRKFIGEEFDAVISGVATFGFWAQTIDHRCEGLVSVYHLPPDEYTYEEQEYALVGHKTRLKFQIGHAVRIRVAGANLKKRQIDYEWVEPGVERPDRVERKKDDGFKPGKRRDRKK